MRLLHLLFLTFGLAHAAEIDTAPLQSWLKAQSGIKTLQTDFIQERKLAALKNPVSTPGTMFLRKGGSMRWNLGKPVKTTALSDGKTIHLIDLEKKRARALPVDSSRARAFTLLGDSALNGGLNGFRNVFELVEAKMTQGIYQLTTRPKDRSLRKQMPWVFFDIDPGLNQLRALEVQLEDKSRIRTIFTKARINQAIPKGTFEFDLSGYKVY